MADLAAMPRQLPSGPAQWELWDGEIRLMPPMGDFHGSVEVRFGTLLTTYGEWEGIGRVSGGDVGVVIQAEDPQTTVGADVVFLTADQLPARHSREGYLLTIPAVIVEVRSQNDKTRSVSEKVGRYLQAGARLVWVADPAKRTVTEHRPGQPAEVLGLGDHLRAPDILPKLDFPVGRLFEGLDD